MVERDRILLVDDAKNWRDTLSHTLKLAPDQIVASADEAKKMLQERAFTGVICDGLYGE